MAKINYHVKELDKPSKNSIETFNNIIYSFIKDKQETKLCKSDKIKNYKSNN